MNKAVRGKYKITKNTEISPGIYELCIKAPEIAGAAEAGQFVNIYLPNAEMLLPRPLSIADAEGDTLTLVYTVVGKGTEALRLAAAGEKLEIMGPLGRGFLDQHDNGVSTMLLIGGGVGIPPLYFAAKKLKSNLRGKVKIIAALGFRETPWYIKEFENVCDEVHVISETTGLTEHTGVVTDLLNAIIPFSSSGIVALACGPRLMLKAAAEWCAMRGIQLRVSMEERMGCGYGACAGCTVKTRPAGVEETCCDDKIVRKKVCTDGPVFRADELVW